MYALSYVLMPLHGVQHALVPEALFSIFSTYKTPPSFKRSPFGFQNESFYSAKGLHFRDASSFSTGKVSNNMAQLQKSVA